VLLVEKNEARDNGRVGEACWKVPKSKDNIPSGALKSQRGTGVGKSFSTSG